MSEVCKGYEPLAEILTQALHQAQAGKGKERHANGLPFVEQPILQEARAVGIGFLAGQARKKIRESLGLPTTEAKKRELLGAINYIAAQIIYLDEQDRQP